MLATNSKPIRYTNDEPADTQALRPSLRYLSSPMQPAAPFGMLMRPTP
jgi:hypothetical protein